MIIIDQRRQVCQELTPSVPTVSMKAVNLSMVVKPRELVLPRDNPSQEITSSSSHILSLEPFFTANAFIITLNRDDFFCTTVHSSCLLEDHLPYNTLILGSVSTKEGSTMGGSDVATFLLAALITVTAVSRPMLQTEETNLMYVRACATDVCARVCK
jgi:hypothetical protein